MWMLILVTFVLQAVSYEFQHKLGNLLGTRTFQWFLIINGIAGPLLLGIAVATFFNGANFIVEKASILGEGNPIISRWTNASHGLDALLNGWDMENLIRTLGTRIWGYHLNQNDGRKDLVVVYHTEDLTRMVVCQNNEGGLVYSEPIPGPIENQQIQFKDIDKEGPIEFIVSGEKNGAVGYAIYRMIDGQPIDLFGEGMADCC